MTTQEKQDALIELFKEIDRPPDFLFGPRFIVVRQRILEIITGKKPPRAKAGINRVMSELCGLFNIDVYMPTCEAERVELLNIALGRDVPRYFDSKV